MTNPRLEYLHEKTKKLTSQSGCYLMKNKKGVIIYVGKAKNLRKRVTSYFRYNFNHEVKVQKMVDVVYDYDYVVTENEFEALVLECSLIKLHQPKYNILLKDDKGYNYIKISNEEYPKITAEKQKLEDGARYIGPYTSSFAVTQSVDDANKSFMLPVCNRKFPSDFGKQRPCLNFHIKQCMGVCTGNISKGEYMIALNDAVAFLTDNSKVTVKHLEDSMEKAAENLEFEKAARLRDRIKAMEKINERQKVVFTSAIDQDVIALARRGNLACAVNLKFRKGRLVDKIDYMLGEVSSLKEAREEFINLYYSDEKTEVPSIINLDGDIENKELTEEFLTKKSSRKVSLLIPQKGENKRLSDMALQNAAEIISFNNNIIGKDLAALDELARLLNLPSTPLYIESYDISNIGSDYMVAGMVVFENGKPNKKMYKRFSIKTMEDQNDYGAMQEVISRRMLRYMEEKDSGEGFGRLPDLILLDGGKGHVSVIRTLLEGMNIDVPVFGMVKDNKHKTRAIAEDGGEISIKSTKSAFHLIYKIQEEVHRYAIRYQREKHSQTTFKSSLTSIEGVGTTRAKNLMKHFKTIKAISQADVDALSNVSGIPKNIAENIYNYFNK